MGEVLLEKTKNLKFKNEIYLYHTWNIDDK